MLVNAIGSVMSSRIIPLLSVTAPADAETIFNIPKLFAALSKVMALLVPAVRVVNPDTVHALASVMVWFSVIIAFAPVMVRSPNWFVAWESVTSCVWALRVNGIVRKIHADAWVISSFSVMVTDVGVPEIVILPKLLAVLSRVITLLVVLSVVVPVVVQPTVPSVMASASVMVTVVPLRSRAPITFAWVRVILPPPWAAPVVS